MLKNSSPNLFKDCHFRGEKRPSGANTATPRTRDFLKSQLGSNNLSSQGTPKRKRLYTELFKEVTKQEDHHRGAQWEGLPKADQKAYGNKENFLDLHRPQAGKVATRMQYMLGGMNGELVVNKKIQQNIQVLDKEFGDEIRDTMQCKSNSQLSSPR